MCSVSSQTCLEWLLCIPAFSRGIALLPYRLPSLVSELEFPMMSGLSLPLARVLVLLAHECSHVYLGPARGYPEV